MKKIKWILPLLLIFLVCGCNYHELNEIYLVSALSVDYDKEYRVSLLVVSDDDENSTRTIEGRGKTLEEVFYNITSNYNKPLYLGHLNLVLIDEKSAKNGIEPLIKIINEDNETKKNFYLILARNTKASEVLNYLSSEKLDTKETEGISKHLSLENIHNQITYNTYTKQNKENNINLLTSYTIKDKELETSNLGVLKNHKLKTWIEETNETLILNTMMKEFPLSIENKTVIIKNISVKKQLSNDKVTFVVKGKVDTSVKNLHLIETKFQEKLEKALIEAEKLNIDYLRLKPFLYDYKKNTNLPLTEINPNIKVSITW